MSEKPEKQEAVAGVGILVAAFTSEEAGEEALKALKNARSQRQVYFEDAAVIRQDAQGDVHYHETGDVATGKGAGVGAIVGGVIGILGGPAGIAAGAAAAGWSMIPGKVIGANNQVNLAAVGIGQQGGNILRAISGQPGVNVVALCDVHIDSDSPVLTPEMKKGYKEQGWM